MSLLRSLAESQDENSWQKHREWRYQKNLCFVLEGSTSEKSIIELPYDIPNKLDQFTVKTTAITSLKGAPETSDSVEIVYNKKLRSLLGGPQHVIGSYHCYWNALETLQGAPEKVGGVFACHNNKLTSFAHAPKDVLSFVGQKNPVKSLRGIGTDYLVRVDNMLELLGLPIESHALGLLLIKRLPGNNSWAAPKIKADFPGFEIIEKYLSSSGEDNLIDCQHELIEAGFEKLAAL